MWYLNEINIVAKSRTKKYFDFEVRGANLKNAK